LTDGWHSYDGLVDVGYEKHLRISKSKHSVSEGVHINGIEACWSFTKRRLTKFNGVEKNFVLHLNGREWHYSKPPQQLHQELRQMIRHNPWWMV